MTMAYAEKDYSKHLLVSLLPRSTVKQIFSCNCTKCGSHAVSVFTKLNDLPTDAEFIWYLCEEIRHHRRVQVQGFPGRCNLTVPTTGQVMPVMCTTWKRHRLRSGRSRRGMGQQGIGCTGRIVCGRCTYQCRN